MKNDQLRPRVEPAATIYDAFEKEAERRDADHLEESFQKEREAVLRAATEWAKKEGWYIPTMEDVENAEATAVGSADYGAKWALSLSNTMIEAVRPSRENEENNDGDEESDVSGFYLALMQTLVLIVVALFAGAFGWFLRALIVR